MRSTKAMFVIYLTGISAGLVYAVAVGVIGH
jgi:hypothetical protein